MTHGSVRRARFREISTVEAAAELSPPISALPHASSALMDQTGWSATVFSVCERDLRLVLDTIMARHPTIPVSQATQRQIDRIALGDRLSTADAVGFVRQHCNRG